jgi:hypothetical protein
MSDLFILIDSGRGGGKFMKLLRGRTPAVKFGNLWFG